MLSSQGYVYILQSQNCECIKIGGTDYPPLKRIKEINATEPYKSLGTKDAPQLNMLMLDSLVLDFPEVKKWLRKHNGTICTETYATALPHSASIQFEGSFSDALELFSLDGVRRSLIAYWYESLIKKSEEDKLSAYERYHNYNAVARIMERVKGI
mgnify:CR=1 FL=1